MRCILLLVACVLVLFLLFSRETFQAPEHVPKTIWTFWDGDMPDVVKRCIDTWSLKNPGYTITVLTKDNLSKYISRAPEISQLKRAQDSPARFSDYIRLYVLEEHGGVWLDASTVCYEPLDHLIAVNGTEFFGYFMPNFTTIEKYPVVESWFMAAPKHSRFIKKWLDEFISVNNHESVEAYVIDIKERGIDLQNLTNPYYLTIHASAQVVLQTDTFDIIVLDANKGPLKYLSQNDWDSTKALDSICSDPTMKTPVVKLRGVEREHVKPHHLNCMF